MATGGIRARGAAAVVLAALAWVTPATAQNGSNFMVLSNGLDVVYTGVGAGGGQIAGVDGLGYWVSGEDLRGNTTVPGSVSPPGPESFFGHKQFGTRWTMCVLGNAAGGPPRLDFPAMVIVEMTGRNAHAPDVFLRPGCTILGIQGLTTTGVLPYGTPGSSSASFLRTLLPSAATGSATGVSSTTVIVLPNNGLVPSARNGLATIIAVASAGLPINSTGFCWTVQFNWLNSALLPTSLVGTQDHPDGWWTWITSSRDGNQYWGLSNDELNAFQARSVITDGATNAVLAFAANVDFVAHSITQDPSTNDALQPAGFTATGVYYATATPGAGGGLPVPNGGFDLGRHVGMSSNGTGGVTNPVTGLVNQDPGNNGLASVPSLGFVTWANEDTNGNGLADEIQDRVLLIQFDWDATFGVDPAAGTTVPQFMGRSRYPILVPGSLPSPWPQPLTLVFLAPYLHTVATRLGNPLWPDPDGFPAGSFGIAPIVGGSLHLSFVGFGPLCLGFPLAFSFGTSGIKPGGGLSGNSDITPPSTSRQLNLLD